MLSLERAHSSRRVGVWSLVGLLLLPLVVAGGFLLATWGSTDRLDRVQAAVVNLDEPVKLDGQLVPLGRQLAGGLVNGNDEDGNFSWLLTDASDAASGLGSGRYAAVVTIPKSFSARATSYAKNDDTAQQATLDVRTSEVSGLSDPVVGQAITAAATKALNTQLTEAYLDNIYVGFNDTGKQFATVADAAGKLSDGTEDLAKGLDQTSDGTTALADGLGQLSTGGADLATGAQKLDTGVATFATGLGQLSDGVAKLPSGTRQLATGTRKSADGAAELAKGTTGLAKGVKTLKSGTAQNATGANAYAAGLSGFQQQIASIAGIPDDTQLAALTQVPCPTPGVEDECRAFYRGLRAGTSVAAGGLVAEQNGVSLVSGAARLADGADELAAGVSKLSTGADSLAGGTTSLASGLDQLADGSDQLADGIPALAAGVKKTAKGADTLSTGVSGLSDGIKQYTDGVTQSATGAEQLSAGMVKLADGGDQLADGTTKLADGLEKGAKEIPSYDKATREKLSETVTTPVTTPRVTSVFSDVATTTLLAVLALWVGGLASYLVLRAVSGRVLASMKSSWRLAGEALAPGAVIAVVQAAALTVLMTSLLDLDGAQLTRLSGLALLAGLTFVAVNHALVAWFGGAGRFVSVLMLVLAAAGSITSAVPEVFDALSPLLPLTPALEGFRAIAAGTGGVGSSFGLLLAWLIVGVVASILAVARRRVAAPLVAVPA